MGATRVYSTAAYYVAAAVAILLGLCPKFGAIVSATPGGVLGGITVVLYGMIGLVGAKIWVENRVDFGDPVNLVGLAAGIIAGIGGVTLEITDDFSLERHRPRHDHGDRLLPPGRTRGPRPRQPTVTPDEVTEGAVKPAPFAYRAAGVPRGGAGRPGRRAGRQGAGRRPEPGAAAVDAARRAGDCSSTSTGCPTWPRPRAPRTGSGSGRWPGTPTCSPTPTLRRVQPLVALALANVAHPTIRNRGTTVGSIVHADAAAEMPVVLRLLGGSVDVASAARAPHDPGRGAVRRPAGVVARPRRDRRRGVLPGPRRRRRASPSRRSPAGTATTRCAASPPLVDRTATGHSAGPATSRSATCPTVVDLTGVADGVTTPRWRRRRRCRRRARPRRRHPRHRRLPRPAGAGADRRGCCDRRTTTPLPGGPHDARSSTTYACTSTARPTRSRVPARRLLSDALRHDSG